jgi:predicted signal transduction protein with EAL and GGDEF domain
LTVPRRQNRTPGLPSGRTRRPRDPRPDDSLSPIVLVSGGLALYFTSLWLGVIVIGDTFIRSAVMAALIVAIAVVGYIFSHQPTPPGDG